MPAAPRLEAQAGPHLLVTAFSSPCPAQGIHPLSSDHQGCVVSMAPRVAPVPGPGQLGSDEAATCARGWSYPLTMKAASSLRVAMCAAISKPPGHPAPERGTQVRWGVLPARRAAR